jgi:cellulose synthase operon protein C
LDDAAGRAATSTNARTLALAGFHAWLVGSKTPEATALWDRALASDNQEPWTLFAQVTLGLHQAAPLKMVSAALAECESNSQHALCAAAARIVFEQVGISPSIDDELRRRIPEILAKHPVADASHLLRLALASTLLNAQEFEQAERAFHQAGALTETTLLGPLSAFHTLDFQTDVAPHLELDVSQKIKGPFGAVTPRIATFLDGRLPLAHESDGGDAYLAVSDFVIVNPATYLMRVALPFDAYVSVDGNEVLRRDTTQAPQTLTQVVALELKSGIHRVAVFATRNGQSGNIALVLQPQNGEALDVHFSAARGKIESPLAASPQALPKGVFPDAQTLASTLAEDVGGALANWIAARDGLLRDTSAARELLLSTPANAQGAPYFTLLAQLVLRDLQLPTKFARSQAQKNLKEALARDNTTLSAHLARIELAFDEGREEDANEALRSAQRVAPKNAALQFAEAQWLLHLGLEGQSIERAKASLASGSGHCQAATHLFELARRNDAALATSTALEATERCQGFLERQADFFRSRGQTRHALAASQRLFQLDESNLSALSTSVAMIEGQNNFEEARRLLDRAIARFPREASLYKLLAELETLARHDAAALQAQRAALFIDGDDVALRSTLSFRSTKKELLQEFSISTAEAIKDYDSSANPKGATSAYVLDSAVVQVFEDGSMVDRTHIIEKALDQQGVQEIAEVRIPARAKVLTLRTLKSNGQFLEPEFIDGRDSVSLPGVQVGDFVEYEYLQSHAAPPPSQPGFLTVPFFFQGVGQANSRSRYVVVAPEGMGLEADMHNVKSKSDVSHDKGREIFRHEERSVPPALPETNGPPRLTESMPFAIVGAKTKGPTSLFLNWADYASHSGQRSPEIRAFAQAAAQGLTEKPAIEAVYTAVMKKLAGNDESMAVSASHSAVADRGSRLWLLKASLGALQIQSRLAVVKSNAADPASFVFPQANDFTYVCLRVDTKQGPLWLDTQNRFGPFNTLPDFALGGREAWLLPDGKLPLERVVTPPRSERLNLLVTITGTLSADGTLAGHVEEQRYGYSAVRFAEQVESLLDTQRMQNFQETRSQYFGGASLSNVNLQVPREVGADATVAFDFIAPKFATLAGAKLTGGALTFPSGLSRRFVTGPTRQTPLFIGADERVNTKIRIAMPSGWHLENLLARTELPKSRSGRSATTSYRRTENQVKNVLTVEESLSIETGRIYPEAYEAFSRFAGDVDLLQQRELVFAP